MAIEARDNSWGAAPRGAGLLLDWTAEGSPLRIGDRSYSNFITLVTVLPKISNVYLYLMKQLHSLLFLNVIFGLIHVLMTSLYILNIIIIELFTLIEFIRLGINNYHN